MATNHPLPKAEAKVVVRNFGTEIWRDSLDFDPITIPVEFGTNAGPLCTDVFDPAVMTIVEALVEAETDSMTFEYMLVWADSEYAVKGTCPMCDDTFPVSEGFTTDIAGDPDVTCAVVCGCIDD